MEFWENIVSGQALLNARKTRGKIFYTESFPKALCDEKIAEGWTVDKEYKQTIRLKKVKPFDVRFEDEVWMVFATLGFQYLNRDRNFAIQYNPKSSSATKQIDVFAVDDETALVIECKSAETLRKVNFKTEIEAFAGIRAAVTSEVKKQFPRRKVKFIFATKNCILSPNDLDRLQSAKILHFDENSIKYYRALARHLGHCARYQLLGNLFAGMKIPEMKSTVPAIEGDMGGHTYYSFSIEPERLLKIAYVLHRDEANNDDDLIPTYQRLIKKERLTGIRQFIMGGGFFPNAVVINIDTKGKKLVLDPVDKKFQDTNTRLGLLHLPQEYRSAYIIDGQHRLYGYADTEYAVSNTIPVIAFVNLPKEEQVRLFMEINENQKTVAKNLRLTLENGIYWDSPNLTEQRRALQSRLAQRLGEDPASPLYNRILIAENEKSATCCITIDYIQNGFTSGGFFTKYDKNNSPTKHGLFDLENNDATMKRIYPFLRECFSIISDGAEHEWSKGEREGGVLSINLGIYGILRVLSDIVEHISTKNHLNPMTEKTDVLIDAVKPYLSALANFYSNMSPKQKDDLRRQRGTGGMTTYWRTLQQAINMIDPDFSPPGLSDWIQASKRIFNDESFRQLSQIADLIKNDIQYRLKAKLGEDWFALGLPRAVYDRTSKRASKFNYENAIAGLHKDPWDFMTLRDCRNIVIKSGNWAEIFESSYTKPEDTRTKKNKTIRTQWLDLLATLEGKDPEIYSVSEDEFNFIKQNLDWIKSWAVCSAI